MARKIVLTGASGQLGQLVSAELMQRKRPGDDIWLCSRNPERLKKLHPDASTAEADFDSPESLDKAFADADVVMLISGNGPSHVRKAQHRAAVEACKRAAVGRIVYTSFVGARADSPSGFAVVHHDTEQAMIGSGLDYTILRVNQYAEVFEPAVASSYGTDKLAMPMADMRVGYIPRASVAAAIAGAVLGTEHSGKTYNLTAGQALNLHEMAAVISEKRGRQIEVIDADPWQFINATMLPFGVPQHVIEGMAGTYAAAAAGDYDVSGTDAAMLAGRDLIGLDEYLRLLA